MQASRRTMSRAVRRALAALLVCALGLALATPARAATTHKRHGHGTSAVVLAGDSGQSSLRSLDTHGVAPVASRPGGLRAGASTPDSSRTASSYPADTSPARGPPEQPA
jgi:hypothetical protein